MYKTAIVTGGAGFLGSYLVDALVERKWNVVVIDNLSTGFKKNVNRHAALKVLDIRNPAASRLLSKIKPAAVFHLAAQISVPQSVRDPLFDAETNIHATLRLLDAAAKCKVKRFLFTSTGGALSWEYSPIPTDEIHAAQPASPYAISKIAAEHYGAFYRNTHKLRFVAIRPANIYGPRQNPHGEAGVVAIFCKRMLKNLPVKINGTGKQTRDYVYVSDAVSSLLLSLDNPKAAGPYNVGTGIETDVNTLFEKIAKLTGYSKNPLKGPADLGAPMRSALDCAKIKYELGWRPEVVLDQGLAKTVEWFRQNE